VVLVTVPDPSFLAALADVPDVDVRLWDLTGPAPAAEIDMVVGPLRPSRSYRDALREVRVGLLQHPGIGYDGVPEQLPPGVRLANTASVQEQGTAELAMAVTLAMQRDLPGFVHAADRREWTQGLRSELAGQRVMLLGYGGIGTALARMLDGFDAELVRVASRARIAEDGTSVHGADELPELLPAVDIVIVAVPLSAATERLVGRAFLAALPDGALVVNVARGRVADTDAILAEARTGRLRFALDTTDPEPLPADHELWSLPGVLITPHVGGLTRSLRPRLERLIREQARRLVRGEPPRNIVFVS